MFKNSFYIPQFEVVNDWKKPDVLGYLSSDKVKLFRALDGEQIFDDSMSMAWTDQEKETREALLQDLKVSKFDWFIKLNLGNWPVIYVTFKDLNYESWESMLSSIRKRISDLYKEHHYIMDNKMLHEDDESLFRKTLDGTIDNSYLIDALSSMSRYLHEYFSKKIIVLIDEYDWPMEHAESFYNEANIFFKCMYSRQSTHKQSSVHWTASC
ncbi:24499_t:CDS:2, partial [Racocetra persica]